MQTAEAPVQPEFKGKKAQKEQAAEVFQIARASARFFRDDAAITIALSALSEFYSKRDDSKSNEQWSDELDELLSSNDHVFLRQERDERVVFMTTRRGIPPELDFEPDTSHSFASRFETPKPKPAEQSRRRPQTRPTIADDPYFSSFETQASSSDSDDLDLESIVKDALRDLDAADRAATAPVVPETPAEVIEDLDEVTDEQLRAALFEQLATDFSVAQFADTWMAEDKTPRLSRGDLRRIRDYIVERGEPVTDQEIVQDVLGIRQNAQEYDLHLFAVNYRLTRESREFEYVGVIGRNAWSSSDLSLLPAPRRRPAEIGQDYRVLLSVDASASEPTGEPVVEHVLTYYEHANGVLPYHAQMRSVLGEQVLPGQRAAVFKVESPQNHESFFVELRFPTNNRGGYLAGFDQFFRDQLVPGGFVSLEPGEVPGVILIEYLPVSGQDRKLLKFDERKSQFTFEAKTFYCAPEEDMLLSENRFPRFEGAVLLEDRARRRPEEVLIATMKRIGEAEQHDGGTRYMAMLDELFCAANVERPMPIELIRDIATSSEHPAFSVDPEADDVIYYQSADES